MGIDKIQMGKSSKPRFEFRSFGQDFDAAGKRMARLSSPVPEKFWDRQSDEIYIMSRKNDINNTKIRDGKMDIKTFVKEVDGLEQWNPLMKGEFPMDAALLKNEVFPAFKVGIPDLDRDKYNYEEFMSLVKTNPDLQAVKVHKQRFGYLIDDIICETGVVLINGARVQTINLESTDTDALKRVISDLGLGTTENINYLQVIKRVIGMISKPLAN